MVGAAAVGMLIIWLGWWLGSTSLPGWIRHPSPVLLGALPIAAVVVVRLVRQLWAGEGQFRAGVRTAVVILGAAGLAVGLAEHVATVFGTPNTLGAQRSIAAGLDDVAAPVLRGNWGDVPTITVLAGKRAVAMPTRPDLDVPVLVNLGDPFSGAPLADPPDYCGTVDVAVGNYVVCEPRAGATPR